MVDPWIPYGRQSISEEDIAAVAQALRSPWLTTGPKVAEFETAFASLVGAAHGVAVSNGTAALHVAMHALGLGPGDEVIVPAMTFAASANAILYVGARPVIVDVDPGTLLLDPAKAEAAITRRTKAIVGVDYAGQPCDWDALREIATRRGLKLVADACHAVGARDKGRPVGSLADVSTFSFHPVKHLTTGEGGMVTTNDAKLAERARVFRSHGITTDHRHREEQGAWFYEMVDLGYNYRLTDLQCALGLSQLKRLPGFVARRREIASQYDAAFARVPAAASLAVRPGAHHAYHLYVVQIDPARSRRDRDATFAHLRAQGIGTQVHYIPVHLHPYYRERLKTQVGQCPVAEAAYGRILSIPLFPGLADDDVKRVASSLIAAVEG